MGADLGIGLCRLPAGSAHHLSGLQPLAPTPVKWILRRFDHSAIYLLIGGTYTPFVTRMNGNLGSIVLLSGVWLTSIVGIALKLSFPGCFDRLSIILYALTLQRSSLDVSTQLVGHLALHKFVVDCYARTRFDMPYSHINQQQSLDKGGIAWVRGSVRSVPATQHPF
jgi:channel protein (hemolysin III family)